MGYFYVIIGISSLMKQYRLTIEQINCKVSESHLIARHIVHWKHLAPYFGLTEPEISATSEDGHDHLDKAKIMLNQWIKKNGSDASYQHLLEVCLKAEDIQLAENICQELKNHSTKGIHNN